MEIYASKDFAMQAIDKKKNCKYFMFINLFTATLAVFIILSGYYPITTITIFVVALYNAYSGYMKMKHYDEQITDISKGFIRFEGGIVFCRQAAENLTYEECEIDIHEISSLIEDTDNGKCGFYVKMQDDYSISHIFVNDMITERNIFYINGLNYNRPEFKDIYRKIRDNIPYETEITGTENQNSWDVVSEKNEFLKLGAPVIFIYIVCVIHLFLYLSVV